MLQWLPAQVSTYADGVDSLLRLIYYIVGGWFVLIHLLMIFMILRFRRREGRAARYLDGKRLRENAWILLPCVLVVGMDFWIDSRSSRVWDEIKESQPPSDLTVRVTGKQFNWEMLYPGPDGVFGTQDDLAMENSLHVPVHKVISILLESEDVLHSFFLPQMRLKQDAVPGRTIKLWFEATKPGRYEIACAELCGFGHTTMRGLLTVHTQRSWEKWVNKRWPAARVARAGGNR
ncbi:MAG: cytochrome c oxidase subunit II [Acidobacteriota bacterium]